MTNFTPLPPLAELREFFEVRPIAPDELGKHGGLFALKKSGSRLPGDIAGSRVYDARRDRFEWYVKLKGKRYTVSRIIYYMFYGVNPGNYEVDHFDKNSDNNNAANLRLAVLPSLQNHNKNIQKNNTSGAVGVIWCKRANKWLTRLLGKDMPGHIGYFTCRIKAAEAYNEAVLKFVPPEYNKPLNNLSGLYCDCGACK